LDFDIDQVANSTTVKLLHLLCLLTLIRMPWRHAAGMAPLSPTCQAFGQLLQQKAPPEMLYQQTVSFEDAMSASPRSAAEADAEKMIADIVAFVKEATEIRETGKKENKLAIKDAKDAQNSLTNAIAVLEATRSGGWCVRSR